jgi:hypothetical protein
MVSRDYSRSQLPAGNLVFVPTSSPNPDYFGGERLGDNLSSCAARVFGIRVWYTL